MTAVLQATGISVSFGGLRAVVDVDLEVRAGQIVGLIGPNGAGKTTFVDAITGFTPYKGSVSVLGSSLDGCSPQTRAKRGLSRTWQSVELFRDLTVFENLIVATRRMTVKSVVLDLFAPRRRRDESDERWALELVALDQVADKRPGELSLGQAKMLGVARALGTRPKVVLLDEPAAGLDSDESTALGSDFKLI